MTTDYDVAIIGGRVAGSVLAAHLGDHGHRTLLVDRDRFPSPTLSTHFFRGAGAVAAFQRLGVLDRVLALGPPRLTRQYFYVGGGDEPDVQPPQEPGDAGFCLSVRREALDQVLRERAAASAGVDVVEHARVTALLRDGDARVTGVRITDGAGERDVTARFVVGADGRHSFVARAVGAAVQEQSPGTRAMYYAYARGMPGPGGATDGPEFSILGDEMAYAFPSDGGVTCVAVSVRASEFPRFRASPEACLAERLAEHRGPGARFLASERAGRVLGTGPEPNYVREAWGPGWALLGDAGIHQDPLTGLGIDFAATHAGFLADALHDALDGRAGEAAALSRYAARRDEHALEKYRFTVAFSRDLRQAAA